MARSAVDSVHTRIGRTALWILLFTVVAKLAGAAKEIAVAWRYGRGPEVDAYNLALTLSTWLPVTLLSVMAVVLVPLLVQLKGRERNALLGDLNALGLLAGSVLVAALWLTAPWLIRTFASGLPTSTQAIAATALRQMAPLALFSLFVSIFTARLQARHNHQYALAEGLPAVVIIALLAGWQTLGVTPLVIAIVVGTAIQCFWLGWLAGREAAPPRWEFQYSRWRWLGRAALLTGFGQLAMSFVTPLDQHFAARLGSGEVATLGYANRLLGLAMTLGATVLSRATLPIFAEGIGAGNDARVRAQALQLATIMLIGGSVAAVCLILVAPQLVSLLFQRGAFTANDTEVVAGALRWGALQLPFSWAGLILVSLLASQRRYTTIAAVSLAALSCKVVANLALVEFLRLEGIFVASTAMYAVSAGLCWLYARSK
ncbi:MAG TPA: lipid II flippase MurJ [Burkholderiales bacterium]|nr:lipid II flippase MurJ [Burkholderiales bacterium]